MPCKDLQEANNYYSTVNADLGDGFWQELQFFLDVIEQNPFVYFYLKNPIRQGQIKRFPYDVIYDIFMAKQNPDNKRTT